MMGNKALLLTKVNLQNTFSLVALKKAPRGERNRAIMVFAAIVIVVASLVGSLVALFLTMGETLAEAGMSHLLPTIGVIAISVMVFMFTLYKANGYLYSFRDFDLLLSLPVTERAVLLSKVFMMYLNNLVYMVLGYVPIAIVHGVVSGAGVVYYLLAFVLMFFLPLIPMVAAALLALPLALVSSRSRFSNLVMLVGSIVLVVLVMWAQFAITSVASEEAVMEALLSARGAVGYYLPAAWLVEGMSGSLLSALLFVGANLLAAAVFVFFYGKAFCVINAKMTERYARSSYKMRGLAVSGRLGALVKRELRGYFSAPVYVLNTAMGVVLATLYIGMLLFMDFEKLAVFLDMPGAADMMLPVTLVVLAFCAVLGTTTACSVSMEGRSFWVLKSLPVSFADVANAKIAMSLLISVPLLTIDITVLAIVINFSMVQFLVVLAVVVLCCLMAALGGLVCNLHFPNLTWKSQTQAVKQSVSVIVAMAMHFALIAIPCVLFVVLKVADITLFLCGVAAYLLLICVVLRMYLLRKGAKLYKALH